MVHMSMHGTAVIQWKRTAVASVRLLQAYGSYNIWHLEVADNKLKSDTITLPVRVYRH